MSSEVQPKVGFLGVGTMGEPMALNLLRAGTPLVVWNRTPEKAAKVLDAGALWATDVRELFARTEIVLVMLSNEQAIDAALGRGTAEFAGMVRGRTVVHMGTTASSFSARLEKDLRAADARYVESPVSGTRKPAEMGELVAMLSGDEDAVELVRPVLAPMCKEMIPCGPVPNALAMKLASNLYVITLVTALAEAVNYARRQGIDMEHFSELLSAGQLSCELLRFKLPKLVARDFSVQGSLANVLASERTIRQAAQETGAAVPLLDVCLRLLQEAAKTSDPEEADMTSVLGALEARST